MQLRVLLIVNAVLATVHGAGFILLPSEMLAFYQITRGPGAQLMGQLFGAELLVVAVITWLGKDLTDAKALAAIVLANLVADVVGTIITVKAVISGVMGTMGWVGVAIYALLSLGYLNFQIRKGGTSR